MSKELVESIVVDDADAIVESFNAVMAEKIADALEVRRVELASGIMDEAVVVHDKDGNPVGRYKNIETAKLLKPTSDGYKHSEDDGLSNKYSGKYPGGKKQRDADKDAFMKRFAKEEVEQIDEVSKNLLGRYGSKAVRAHLAAKSAGDTEKAAKRAAGVNLASAKSFPGQYKNSPNKAKVAATNEEAEQIDEVGPLIAAAAGRLAAGAAARGGAGKLTQGALRTVVTKKLSSSEQQDESAQLSDRQRMSKMGIKDPALLTAVSAYRKHKDINKIPTAMRNRVSEYLSNTVPSNSSVESNILSKNAAAAKKAAKQTEEE